MTHLHDTKSSLQGKAYSVAPTSDNHSGVWRKLALILGFSDLDRAVRISPRGRVRTANFLGVPLDVLYEAQGPRVLA